MHSDAKQDIDTLVEMAAETVTDITDKYNADQQLVMERLLKKLGYLAGLGGFDLVELEASLGDGFQQGEMRILAELDALFSNSDSDN